ncbi:hypothetical protein D3C86_2008960 [compost metagenome]
MSAAGAEAALCCLFKAHAGLQVLAQELQAFAGSRGKAQGRVTVIADLQACRLAAEVGLVADQGDLGRVGLLVEELRPEREGIGSLGGRGVHHQ